MLELKDRSVCGSNLLWRWVLHSHLAPAVYISLANAQQKQKTNFTKHLYYSYINEHCLIQKEKDQIYFKYFARW